MIGLNWIWIGLLIFVIVLDICTSSFIFSWLGIGFIIAFITGFFLEFITQLFIAAIVGTIAIIIGLKVSKKYIKGNLSEEKLLVGKYEDTQFTADFNLESNKECRVKVKEVYWTAKNIGNSINQGDVYTVLKIENNKLIIQK